MKLVAGSYERFLWGYDVKTKRQELQWRFAYPAHMGPVKCIAACGAVVATGGADDTIRVFDVAAQKDMGSLYKHEGAVTCLDFHNSHPGVSSHPSHLLSGSDDGSICIWDTDAWIHLLTMKAKKGPKAPVQGLSIHTSGFLALSIERNRNMKMWNLTKGRCSFTTKLPSEAEIVKFFPQAGESYALALGSVMEIRNAETGSTIHRLENDKRILCMAQRQDDLLVTGGDDSVVRAWDTRSGQLAWSVANAHSNRIKGVAILGSNSDAGEVPATVASASSDGMLKVWDTRMVGSDDGSISVSLMEAETKARLTCLVSTSGVKKISASEGVSKGDGVQEKQRSSGVETKKTDKKKKKRKARVGDSNPGDEKTGAVLGRKRQKKQSVKVNTKKHGKRNNVPSTPLPNTALDSRTPGSTSPSFRKRPSREKSKDDDDAAVQNRSLQKKRKLSLKKYSQVSSGKSPKSLKSTGSVKFSTSPGSGKSGKKRKNGKS